jgi:DNA-binding transcriptional MerR regulator
VFQIGAFARLAGISAKQLRAYDAIGLFRPAWIDPASGYRRYSPAQLPELRRILALRQLGMGLDEIGRIADGGDLRLALERRRTELERERRTAEERLAALEISIAGEPGPDVVVRPIAAEPVAVMSLGDRTERAFEELETYVRDLGRRASGPPGAIGSRGDIFVPVTGPIPSHGRIEYRRLPACRIASVMHHGRYEGIGETRRVLRDWVERAGLVQVGPMRALYLAFGAGPGLGVPPGYLVDRAEDFVTELQLPVGPSPDRPDAAPPRARPRRRR